MTQEKTPMTPLAQRIATLQEQKGGRTASQVIREAQEVLRQTGLFFWAVEEGDALGIESERNLLGYSLAQATRAWYARSWGEWRESIRTLQTTEEGDAASRILRIVEAFEENPLVGNVLAPVMNQVGRPSRLVLTGHQFNAFLQEGVGNGLVIEQDTAPSGRRGFEWEGRWYTHASFAKARAAWVFYVHTLTRVRRYMQIQEDVWPRLESLKELATMDPNPEQQGLHRLLHGVQKAGRLVIWDHASRVGQERMGLIAIVIGREKTRDFPRLTIFGSVADKPLLIPMDAGYTLPPLQIRLTSLNATEIIGYELKERKNEEEFQALMRILYLLRRRLSEEGRFQIPAIEAPKDQPTANA